MVPLFLRETESIHFTEIILAPMKDFFVCWGGRNLKKSHPYVLISVVELIYLFINDTSKISSSGTIWGMRDLTQFLMLLTLWVGPVLGDGAVMVNIFVCLVIVECGVVGGGDGSGGSADDAVGHGVVVNGDGVVY